MGSKIKNWLAEKISDVFRKSRLAEKYRFFFRRKISDVFSAETFSGEKRKSVSFILRLIIHACGHMVFFVYPYGTRKKSEVFQHASWPYAVFQMRSTDSPNLFQHIKLTQIFIKFSSKRYQSCIFRLVPFFQKFNSLWTVSVLHFLDLNCWGAGLSTLPTRHPREAVSYICQGRRGVPPVILLSRVQPLVKFSHRMY